MAGPNTPRNTLKDFFKAGNIPLEENFADLIDASINQMDDGIQKRGTDPLKIQAAQSNPTEEVLRFYKDITGKASWVLGLNPETTAGGSRKRGLQIADGEGNSRLFIDEATGHIGIGHAHPQNNIDLGPTQGKKLALFQNAQGSDFYGLGISHLSLDFHAGSTVDGSPKMAIKKNGNIGIGVNDPGGYRIQAVARISNEWAYRFDNLHNGSNIHIAHGVGNGLHVNGGTNASANTYLLELYSGNNIGLNHKFKVFGDGAIRANAYKTDWGFIFHNSENGSNIHAAHGNGNGLHVNGGRNASASTYLLELYSNNSIGEPSKFKILGDGSIRSFTNNTDWGFIFHNSENGSNIHAARGDGNGLHVNGGRNASANTYLLEAYSQNSLGHDTKFIVKGDGKVGIGTYPGIQLAIGDSDTGFQQQGDGELAIYTDNVERIRIDNAGNVGIGTDDPQIQLALGDTDTGFQQQGDGELGIYTENVERIRIDNAGNVGIGTNDPQIQLALGDTDTGFQQQGDGELGVYTNSLERLRIDNAGNVGIGTNDPQIQLALGDTDTGFQQKGAGELGIYTENVERIRINNTGRVGIGTNNPDSLLHISKNSSTVNSLEEILRLERLADDASTNANAEGGYIGLYLHDTSTGNPTSQYASRIEGARISWRFDNAANDERSGRLGFWTSYKDPGNAANSVLQERMTITKDGNVGIGTNDPTAKLDVDGDMKTSGLLDIGSVTSHGELNIYNVFSDIRIGLDNSPTGNTLATGWQSFQLSESVFLVKIEANQYGSNQSGLLNIFEGEGIVGTKIHSQPYGPYSGYDVFQQFVLTNPLRINAGSKYTIQIVGFSWMFSTQTNVSGGRTNYAANTNYSFKLHTSPTPLTSAFSVKNSGIFMNGLQNIGDNRNLQWIESTGQLGFDNSSRRYKENIQPLKAPFKKILQLQPRTYYRTNKPSQEIGLIAEEVHNLGLTNLVYYDNENQPDGLNYEKICLYLLEVLRDHEAMLKPDSKYLERYIEEVPEKSAKEEPVEILSIDESTGLAIEWKPSSKNTKAEIQNYLKEKGIPFSKTNSKTELLKKIE